MEFGYTKEENDLIEVCLKAMLDSKFRDEVKNAEKIVIVPSQKSVLVNIVTRT
jgi:hypothetical protein